MVNEDGHDVFKNRSNRFDFRSLKLIVIEWLNKLMPCRAAGLHPFFWSSPILIIQLLYLHSLFLQLWWCLNRFKFNFHCSHCAIAQNRPARCRMTIASAAGKSRYSGDFWKKVKVRMSQRRHTFALIIFTHLHQSPNREVAVYPG